MNYFVDVAYDSINKYGEELCGDKVEIVRTDDSIIIVLADGLGSGVKANILSTLTSKIAVTMLKEGASIYETIDTIVHTLPVCSVRKIAYSTFTIIKVYKDGRVYIAEYDNPPYFFIRNNNLYSIRKSETISNGKLVKESSFTLKEGDVLSVVSDGAIHAGVGAVLNLGWQWENVADYLKQTVYREKCAKNISKNLVKACLDLYANKPGDDTTVVAVKFRRNEIIDLFTGPPLNRENDRLVLEKILSSKGKKVVCGGTAANIISRELGEEIVVNMEVIDPEVPPTANIKGFDLVTEGVLTLSKVVDKIKRYVDHRDNSKDFEGRDGASKLAKMLVEDCTHLNLWVGKAINPAHQNPNLPVDLSIKLKLVDRLVSLLRQLGLEVVLTYI